jgi:hypothetical protein
MLGFSPPPDDTRHVPLGIEKPKRGGTSFLPP